MDRSTYRLKHTNEVLSKLHNQYGEFYHIPEGGTNELALKGAAEIVEGIERDYDFFAVACGTAGTITGIISGLNGHGKALGFSVLKGDFHKDEVKKWLKITGLTSLNNWQINTNYHFGGYAKYDWSLIKFINRFKEKYDIPLDPIYTGKVLFGVCDLISKGYFPENTKILAIHSGGLQGIKGFNERFNNLLNN